MLPKRKIKRANLNGLAVRTNENWDGLAPSGRHPYRVRPASPSWIHSTGDSREAEDTLVFGDKLGHAWLASRFRLELSTSPIEGDLSTTHKKTRQGRVSQNCQRCCALNRFSIARKQFAMQALFVFRQQFFAA